METNRLRTGERIAAVAALALLIIMFLPWFGLSEESATTQGEEFQEGASVEELEEAGAEIQETFADVDEDATSVDFSAFESFGFIDIILLLAIAVAIGLAVARATARNVDLPVAASALTAGLGILAAVLILYRIIDPPSVSFLEYDREFGVFLGLLAALGIAFGGWRSMQQEGTTFAGEAERLGDRFDDDRPGGPPAGGAPPGDTTPPPPPAPPAGGPPAGGAPPPRV